MAFAFNITKVEKLPLAGLGLLSGTVLEGHIVMGQQVTLVHDGRRIPLQVTAVVLGSTFDGLDALTLSVNLSEPALDLAQVGDKLVSIT